MKRILLSLMVMLTMSISTYAMSYNQARREALFLTDKMAYELNLTPEQYDAAYEINLDYLMGVTSVDDVFSTYWTRRNLDLSYILLDWQWNAFRSASYFYKPLYWDAGYWHFGIYARYPHRHYFYFDRPSVYVSYRGGHGWYANGGRSFYYDRRNDFHRNNNELGMRDRWNRGDFNGARNNNISQNGSWGNRVEGNRSNTSFGNNQNNGSFGGSRSNTSTTNPSNSRFSPSNSSNKSNGSFGGARTNGSFSSPSNKGMSTSNSSSSATQSRMNGSFGGNRGSISTPTPSRPSSSTFGSFGGNRGSISTSTPSRSSSSSSSGSFGGSRSSNNSGGSVQRGSFGGQR